MPQIVEYNGSNLEFPDGMPASEIEAVIKKNALSLPASVSAGKAINRGISDIPRQVGLTARYGLEGLAQIGQIGTEPVAGFMRAAGIPTKSLSTMATDLADKVGLPSPQGANERVIGDAARMMAGAGGFGGAANVAARLPGMVGAGGATLAANPAMQIGSAAGSGLAGGASREAGGGPMQQFGASLMGGLTGGSAVGAGNAVLSAGKRLLTPNLTPQQLDTQITTILERAGTDYRALPMNVQASLRTEMRGALQAGKELDPAAVRRLADFAQVPGASATRGMVSQNPVQITREMNLAKIGANSQNDQLSGLALQQNRNNATLIGQLNNLGGRSEVDGLRVGRLIEDRIGATHAGMQQAEQAAWDAAKQSPGYKQPVFPDALNAINKTLSDDGMLGYLPKQITDYMEVFQTGQQPFTAQAYRNLQSMLSAEMRKGGNEAAAAGQARTVLESTVLKPLTETGRDIGSAPVTQAMAAQLRSIDAQPENAFELVNSARSATAQKYRYEEGSPLVRSVLSGGRSADPEKIAQSFVLSGTVNDARAVAREVGPEGVATIRDALATHIKRQALNNASDETGKVSQSALNAAIRKIGDEKLRLFFSAEDIAALKATGRVATYMQNQPAGSAVNNSNSGALVLGRGGDFIDQFARKIPFGQAFIADPVRNINISLSQRQAQNAGRGLLIERERESLMQPFLLPGIAASGGLLSSIPQ